MQQMVVMIACLLGAACAGAGHPESNDDSGHGRRFPSTSEVTVGEWQIDLENLSEDALRDAIDARFKNDQSFTRFFGISTRNWLAKWGEFSEALIAESSRIGLPGEVLRASLDILKPRSDDAEVQLPVAAFAVKGNKSGVVLIICLRANGPTGNKTEFGHVDFYLIDTTVPKVLATTGCW